jgi:hypothetical protein
MVSHFYLSRAIWASLTMIDKDGYDIADAREAMG